MDKQEKINKFFELLFPYKKDAATCITNSLFDTSVSKIYPHECRQKAERFVLNPLELNKDNEGRAPKGTGRRADINVVDFRNILAEFDKNTIDEQIAWLNKSRLPYSAIVHSGKKSLHVIISLEDPVRSMKEYKSLAKQLYAAILNAGIRVDDSTSNPSRLTRYPGAIREDTKVEQELLYVGNRVSKGILKTWIKQHAPKAPARAPAGKKLSNKESAGKYISHTTMKLIKEHEHYTESRHQAFKSAAVQLRKSGHEIDEIETLLYEAYRIVIPERDQLSALLKWVDRNVIPDQE